MNYRKRKNDEVWHVNVEELHFDHPVQIVGQGAFGVVLLAEYRGTKVAIKRVLPKKDAKKTGSVKTGSVASIASIASAETPEEMKADDHDDVEAGEGGAAGTTSGTTSGFGDLDFLNGYSFGTKRSRFRRWFGGKDESSRYNLSILGSVSNGNSLSQGLATWLFPACNETARRHEEFKEEMRLLSRLRHPCITTVMGAVMNGIEPVSWLRMQLFPSAY